MNANYSNGARINFFFQLRGVHKKCLWIYVNKNWSQTLQNDYAARCSIYGTFNNMGFLIYGFPIAFLRPGETVNQYVSVPVELFKSGQNLANIWTSGQRLGKICPKSGYADRVFKT